MKSLLLYIVILLSTSISLFAQNESELKHKKFSFGTGLGIIYGTPIGPSDKADVLVIGASPNIDTVVLNSPKGTPGLGLHFGVFGRYDITDKVGIQLGIGYSAKKAKYKAPVNNQGYTYRDIINEMELVVPTFFSGNVRGEFNNKYLEIPFLVLYRLSDKWTIEGGGYTALLLRGSHKVWASGIVGDNFTIIENKFSDESAFISKWDYGMNLGTSYKILNQLEAEFRISTGLRSIFSDDYQLAEDTIRNVYMELKANYVFGF